MQPDVSGHPPDVAVRQCGLLDFCAGIVIFYSGELVWRERDAQISQVLDAHPLQRWVPFSPSYRVDARAGGHGGADPGVRIVVQILQGFYHFQFGLYVRELFLNRLTPLWILCVLAILVQTIVNNKYLGHFVMVLYIVATIALPPAGFQDYLYRFGEAPQVTYSDINGYGPFLQPLIWFRIYWIIAAYLLAIITNLFWVRGTESSWRVRMNLAAARFSRVSVAGASPCAWY